MKITDAKSHNFSDSDRIVHRYVFARDDEEANIWLEHLRLVVAHTAASVVRRKTRCWRYVLPYDRIATQLDARTVVTQVQALAEQLILSSVKQWRKDATPPMDRFRDYTRHLCILTLVEYQRRHFADLWALCDQLHNLAEQDARFEIWSRPDMSWTLGLRGWLPSGSSRSYNRTLARWFEQPPVELVDRYSQIDEIGGLTEAILRMLDGQAAIEDLAPLVLCLRKYSRAADPQSSASTLSPGLSFLSDQERWMVAPLVTSENLLQEFKGYIKYVENGSAYVVLVDQDGRRADAVFDAERLKENGIAEGDNFTYTISKANGSLIARFLRTEPKLPSEEEWRAIRTQLTTELGDYQPTHE